MRHKLRDVLFVSLMLGSLCKLASPQGTPVGVTTDPIPCPSTGKIIPAGTRGDQLDSLCPPSGSGASTALTPQHQMLQAISPTVQGAAYNFGFALGQWLFGANDNSADAVAQQQAYLAELQKMRKEAEHQRLLAEQQRVQAIFDRLKHELMGIDK